MSQGPAIDMTAVASYSNVVDWVFSGVYDEEKPVLIDAAQPTRSVSKKGAQELVAALAGCFEPDSTVCLHIANDVLYPVLVLAILASNCHWTGTNTAYTAPELEHHFLVSNTKYVVTEPEHLDVVCTAVEASGINAEIILFADVLDNGEESRHAYAESCTANNTQPLLAQNQNDSAIGTPSVSDSANRTLRDLLRKPAPADLGQLTKRISLDSAAALMQTSGTTGLPKMAIRTHRSMIIEQQTIEDNNAAKPYEVRRLYCTPIMHGFAAPEMIFNVLRLGQTSYFMRRFDDTFAQKVHDLRITETFGAPPMLLRLVSQPGARALLQSLRMIAFGGAALAPELRKKTLDLFDVKPRIVPVYGMTEGGWFTTLKYPEEDYTGSLGCPIPGYEVRIVPQKNAELDSGQGVGEILVRGPQLMSGYLGNPEATADAFEDTWLRTGDIGYIKDAKVYLVDRAKDLIKVSAWQVAPAEVENALLQHPDVLDAAVIGVGEDVAEHPLACVVVRNSSLTADAILLHLRSHLSGYKVSRCEVQFVETIPKNPAGKILRKILREQVLGTSVVTMAH
ncbi:hypothetical protein LTR08_007152 [Meristemomyces frigidus]|nr:hypothetical protein LTR08_007152 [Meristemomyces frigidus]